MKNFKIRIQLKIKGWKTKMVDVKNIVIIGAGLMGHNAGQIFLMGGYNVTLVDIKDEFVDNGVAKIDEGLKSS